MNSLPIPYLMGSIFESSDICLEKESFHNWSRRCRCHLPSSNLGEAVPLRGISVDSWKTAISFWSKMASKWDSKTQLNQFRMRLTYRWQSLGAEHPESSISGPLATWLLSAWWLLSCPHVHQSSYRKANIHWIGISSWRERETFIWNLYMQMVHNKAYSFTFSVVFYLFCYGQRNAWLFVRLVSH